MENKLFIIDPSYQNCYEGKLFDISDEKLNRDGTLVPFYRLRLKLEKEGASVVTADQFLKDKKKYRKFKLIKYYSFGITNNIEKMLSEENILMEAFFIMEPPNIAPNLYRKIKQIAEVFNYVYVHNTIGDGYKYEEFMAGKLRKLYYPMPFDVSLKNSGFRLNKIVVINSNHNPYLFAIKNLSLFPIFNENYSKRIIAISSLNKISRCIDLYGMRWNNFFSIFTIWPTSLLHFKVIKKIYQGSCTSKYEILGRYNFCLCFENMGMRGYITEKIFDCFIAGTIPIYFGAEDISDYVPKTAYVDFREFADYSELHEYIFSLSDYQLEAYRKEGANYISGSSYKKHFNFLENEIN